MQYPWLNWTVKQRSAGGALERLSRLVLVCILLPAARVSAQSPVEFGMQEVRKALAEHASGARTPPELEYSSTLPADGFQIQGGSIMGGSRRGGMYGLLEAASQLREHSSLTNLTVLPLVAIRSARLNATDALLARPDREWSALFRSLAYARFNRLRLDLTALTHARTERLSAIARLAELHAVDLSLGLQELDSTQVLKLFGSSIVFKALRPPPELAVAAVLLLSEVGRYATLDVPTAAITAELKRESADLHVPLLGLAADRAGAASSLWLAPLDVPESLAGLAGAAGYETGPLGENWAMAGPQLREWTMQSFTTERGKAAAEKKSAAKAKPKAAKKTARKRRK